jgi:hypothetical protein
MADPEFPDYFGVIDAAIGAHLALCECVGERAAVLDDLLDEYEVRVRAALGEGQTLARAVTNLDPA